MKDTYKHIRILSSFLLFFVLIVDPTNVIFHIKEICFVLFCLINIKSIRFNYFYIFILFLSILFFTLIFSFCSSSFIFDEDFTLLYIKSFLFLFLLCYVYIDELRLCKIFLSCILAMSLLEIVIYILYSNYPSIASVIYTYVAEKNFPIMLMGKRSFLNGRVNIFSVFYTTSPLIVMVLPICSLFYLETRKKKYLFFTILLVLGLFFSGTRANILSCFLLLLLVYLINLYRKKKINSLGILISMFICVLVFILFVFLSDKSDTSLSIKQEHIKSIMKLFDQNPIRYLLVGSGAGSLFYTTAWHRYTTNCEVVYIDLIRMFGLIPFLIMFFFMLYPVLLIYNNKNNTKIENSVILLGYLQYLIIGGTNPLIIGSTGFCAIYIAYYLSNADIKKELIGDFHNFSQL